jgi:beta-lactam-binding protein with PASTA domain
MTKTKKILLAVIALVVVLISVTAILLFSSKPKEAIPTAASHISLAEKYLLDLNYEAAIAEYRAAIQIDPKNADYYIALSEIYVEMGDIDGAVGVLEEGLLAVDEGDRERIRAMLERIMPIPVETIPVETTQSVTTITDIIQNKTISYDIINNIYNMTSNEADEYLENMGLYVESHLQFDEIVEKDKIISFEPVLPEYIPGQSVKIRISKGLDLNLINNSEFYSRDIFTDDLDIINGMNYLVATEYLESFGFVVTYSKLFNSIYPEDTVVYCNCDYQTMTGRNKKWGYGVSQNLFVSAGLPPDDYDKTPIPDVNGVPVYQAASLLEKSGYKAWIQNEDYDVSTVTEGCVYGVISGVYYEKEGAHITLQFEPKKYDNPQGTPSPDFLGMSVIEALKEADSCKIEVDIHRTFNNAPYGIVYDQEFAKGVNVTKQTLYYSLGYDD